MSQPKASNILLFIVPALIWGSTWYVIKFQLGTVDPLWSVCYRFMLGGFLLLLYAAVRRINLKFSLLEHGRMALQGVLLFGVNYWLVYEAEEELTSALVAIAFSTVIFFNIFFGSLFLGRKTAGKVYWGAGLGLLGTFLLFYQDLTGLQYEVIPVFSVIVCVLSVIIASLGNITSAANQSHGIPVIQANGFGMIYGALGMALVATILGITPTFDLSMRYLTSLLYLSFFGSITAFGAYLTLIGRIGPDRAAYVLVSIPVTALAISMVLEDYQLNLIALAGVILILTGNLIVLKK